MRVILMPKSVNRVALLGHVGKEPEVNNTPSGTLVVKFTLATSDRYKDNHGDFQERTDWHSLVAFSKTGEIIRDYVKKGSKLYIEGKLQTRSWDDTESGQKRYKTEIVVREISLLGDSNGSRGGNANVNKRNGRHAADATYGTDTDYAGDDGIPF
jgi:single-strand DNA-binding protein